MGLSAHSPVSPSWPHVRMFFSGPRAAAVDHLVPSHAPVRCAQKMPSIWSSVSPASGFALLTTNISPGVDPWGSS